MSQQPRPDVEKEKWVVRVVGGLKGPFSKLGKEEVRALIWQHRTQTDALSRYWDRHAGIPHVLLVLKYPSSLFHSHRYHVVLWGLQLSSLWSLQESRRSLAVILSDLLLCALQKGSAFISATVIYSTSVCLFSPGERILNITEYNRGKYNIWG